MRFLKARAIEHLNDLRYRLLVVFLFFIVFFCIAVFLSPLIINQIVADLSLTNVKLVTLSPLEFVYTQIKIGFICALALSIPVIIYHLVRFVKPGLKNKEVQSIRYILPGFFLFFAAGVFFAYFVFLKVGLFFLANLSTLADISNFWSINKFISFIFMSCIILGCVFELPLVLLLLNKLNILKLSVLKKYRIYFYVIAFVLAALLTPPDVVTQILIALPLIILYEASLLVMRFF